MYIVTSGCRVVDKCHPNLVHSLGINLYVWLEGVGGCGIKRKTNTISCFGRHFVQGCSTLGGGGGGGGETLYPSYRIECPERHYKPDGDTFP